MMIWVDYVLLGVIAISALISIVRGFFREAMALIGWVAAVWVVVTFTEPVSALFADQLSVPSMRLAVAAATLFVATLVTSGLIVFLIGKLVDKTGLSGTDRALGVVFGAARGVVIVALLVLLAGLTQLPGDSWWRQSVLIPHFEVVAQRLRGLLPENLSAHMSFSQATRSPVSVLPSAVAPVTGGLSKGAGTGAGVARE